MEVLGVFGATDVPGKTGLCGRSVPKGRPVLWSGVAGGKPRFSGSGGVAAPILFAGAVVPILFAALGAPMWGAFGIRPTRSS